MKRMKVVRVSKDEFELADGRVIPHVLELDIVPSVGTFQEILNEQYSKLGIGQIKADKRGHRLIGIAEACELVGVTGNTFRAWTKAGKIEAIRTGERGHRKYRLSDVHTLMGVNGDDSLFDALKQIRRYINQAYNEGIVSENCNLDSKEQIIKSIESIVDSVL